MTTIKATGIHCKNTMKLDNFWLNIGDSMLYVFECAYIFVGKEGFTSVLPALRKFTVLNKFNKNHYLFCWFILMDTGTIKPI